MLLNIKRVYFGRLAFFIFVNMIIIFNNIIPFKGFTALACYPFLFVRYEFKSYQHTNNWYRMIQHEKIHFKQQIEMLFLFFYCWYVVEFVIRLVIHKNVDKAYRNISFEKEAYQYEQDENYLFTRKKFHWLHFLKG